MNALSKERLFLVSIPGKTISVILISTKGTFSFSFGIGEADIESGIQLHDSSTIRVGSQSQKKSEDASGYFSFSLPLSSRWDTNIARGIWTDLGKIYRAYLFFSESSSSSLFHPTPGQS